VIDADELAAWLRLLLAPGVGRETARRLLAAFGSPEAVAQASQAALAEVAGPRQAAAVKAGPPQLDAQVDAVQRWLAAGSDRHLLTLGDAAYPQPLLESPDPPLLLYVRGDLAVLGAASLAIVGSRKPTAQGLDHARGFAQAFAEAELVVVSGLALGIDGAAHEGALAGGGKTLAVLGTGIDRAYPRRHADLAERIAVQGALVSEFVPGTPPLAENFPQRNRVIAGLSLGTLVVEAALRSGSLITARLANEAGREVFALPGSIHAEQSRGCHALIRDGARLVESPAEILDELRRPSALLQPAPRPRLRPDRLVAAEPIDAASPERGDGDPPGGDRDGGGDTGEDPLLRAIGHDPISLDSLQARTGWPTPDLLARLLELELRGQVVRLPGGLLQRRGRA
jgi:DNA processing protein